MRSLLVAFTVCFLCGCPSADPCNEPGSRTVTFTSEGLPAGVDGTIHVNGQTVSDGGAVTLSSGKLALSADIVTVSSAQPVRTAYQPLFDPDDQCVAPDAGLAITANWFAIPTSGSLWVLNQNANAQLLGFPAPQTTSGSRRATISTQTDIGQFTFDKNGNVWAVQGTTASAALNFYPASSFGSTGARTPTVALNVSALSGCTRGASALAFDAQGNLWLASDCDGKVFKLSRDSLDSSGTLKPLVTLSVPSPGGLAFDATGRLFVASRMDGRVYRFDAAQLSADAAEPAAKIGARVTTEAADTSLYSASWLAFDSHGALWFNDFGSNTFVSISASNLSGTGIVDVQPAVRVNVDSSAVLENFAFDEKGGLWSAGAQGQLIRFSADQLAGSGLTVPDRVIVSSDIGSANSVALYPAPAGLPLFHSLP